MKMSREQLKLCRDFLNITFPFHASSCVRGNVLSKSRKDGVSVIIPCFNEERDIGRCADSVLSQHFSGELQVIFVDDGSTDGTGRLLDAYAGDRRVKVIHQENMGFSGARNRGIEEADMKYLFFTDADDFLPDQNVIEDLYKTAESSGADILEGATCFDEPGNPPDINPEIKVLSPVNTGIVAWGKLYNAKIFEKLIFPEGYWYEDTVIPLLAVPLAKKALKTKRVCYVKTDSETSASRHFSGQKKSLDQYYLLEMIIRDSRTLGVDFSEELYEAYLLMSALTYLRTARLGAEVSTAVFYLLSELIGESFPDCSAENRFAGVLETAMKSGSYPLFKEGAVILARADAGRLL